MDSKTSPLEYVDNEFDPPLIVFPKGNLKELSKRLRHYYKGYTPVFSLKARVVMEDEEGAELMKEEECQSEM